MPLDQTIRITGLSEITIRGWFDKFRFNLTGIEWQTTLKDTVQMDEAYFKKAAVIAAKDISNKKVVLRVLQKANIQKQNTTQFIVRHIEPDSDLFTDGASIYKGIGKSWPVNHKYDIHSKWQFGKTSEIEGLFGNLRTFIRRKYHHVTRSKLPYIVAEFQANFNHPEIFNSPNKYLEKSLILVPTC
jgi:transposase-like protein